MIEGTPSQSYSYNAFIVLLLASLLLHFAFVLLFKQPATPDKPIETVVDVELLTLEEPTPKAKPVKSTEPSSSNNKAAGNTSSSKTDTQSSPSSPVTESQSTVEAEPQKEPPPPPKPSLALRSKRSNFGASVTSSQLKTAENDALNIPLNTNNESASSDLDNGLIPTLRTDSLQEVMTNESRNRSEIEARNLVPHEIVTKDVAAEATTAINPTGISNAGEGGGQGNQNQPALARDEEGISIQGELRNRNVIYKPEPPDLFLDRDVTVVLKFTVLPNGQVDQVFPFQKADSDLEQAAIEMLYKYRFEPLFGSNQVQEGIIHFTIFRKGPQ